MEKGKTVHVPVTEEGVIRKEQITDPESLGLSMQLLIKWASESKNRGWNEQDAFPIFLFFIQANSSDYAKMKLEPEGQHQLRMRANGFVNGFKPEHLKQVVFNSLDNFLTSIEQKYAESENNDKA